MGVITFILIGSSVAFPAVALYGGNSAEVHRPDDAVATADWEKAARIARVKQLLAETALSLEAIAARTPGGGRRSFPPDFSLN